MDGSLHKTLHYEMKKLGKKVIALRTWSLQLQYAGNIFGILDFKTNNDFWNIE